MSKAANWEVRGAIHLLTAAVPAGVVDDLLIGATIRQHPGKLICRVVIVRIGPVLRTERIDAGIPPPAAAAGR